MILVFGSINIDLVARVASIPRPGETVLSEGYETLFGGKGANQAVAAARVCPAGTVVMVGRVGNDAFGTSCIANLDANGVGTGGIERDRTLPTGCAFITVDGRGENAITVASGANTAVEAGGIETFDLGADTIAILQMEVQLAASLAAARKVKAAGGRVIWNLAPAPADLAESDLGAILATTDILIVNEIEAGMAARLIGPGSEDAKADIAELASRGPSLCVLTAGADGAFAAAPDGTMLHAPALAIQPVDTTGAGDSFVGILAAELHRGAAISDALRAASIGASLACLKAGAQPGMPNRAKLDAASSATGLR